MPTMNSARDERSVTPGWHAFEFRAQRDRLQTRAQKQLRNGLLVCKQVSGADAVPEPKMEMFRLRCDQTGQLVQHDGKQLLRVDMLLLE